MKVEFKYRDIPGDVTQEARNCLKNRTFIVFFSGIGIANNGIGGAK